MGQSRVDRADKRRVGNIDLSIGQRVRWLVETSDIEGLQVNPPSDLDKKKCSSQGEGGTLAEAPSLYSISNLIQGNWL